jgi:hypothetical protein
MKRSRALAGILTTVISGCGSESSVVGGHEDGAVGLPDGGCQCEPCPPHSKDALSPGPEVWPQACPVPDTAQACPLPDTAQASCPAADTVVVPASPPLIGTWVTCSAKWEFLANGTYAVEDEALACGESGTWKLDGPILDLQATAGTCVGTGHEQTISGATVAEVSGGLAWLHSKYTHGRKFLLPEGASARRFKLIEDGSGDTQILSIVGGGSGEPMSGCYWSDKPPCGGFLSCGGTIEDFREPADGSFTFQTTCSGECPCGAVLVGQIEDGKLAGTAHNAQCLFSETVTFTGEEM